MTRVKKANMYPFCFGPLYFSSSTGEALLELKLANSSTVREYLGGMTVRKGYEFCTSHTLVPALKAIFDIPNDFDERPSFKDYSSRFCAAARNSGDAAALEQLAIAEKTPLSGDKKNKKKRKGV